MLDVSAARAYGQALGNWKGFDIAQYKGVRLLREVLQAWQVQTTFVDAGDPAAVRAAITPATRLLWVETPSNPLLKLTDLAAIAEIAQAAKLVTVCDNTFATPVLQSPFDYGMDFIMHSATKYLGGHSDVLGGAIVARVHTAFSERLRLLQSEAGAVPSPFDCWLLLRGAALISSW